MRKHREVRKRITDTATQLFLKRGFDKVSVEEIARAADVSRATIFNYFDCKEDLVLGAAPELIEHMRRALEASRKNRVLRTLRDTLLESAGNPLSGTIPAVKWFWPLVASTPSLRARAQYHAQAFEIEVAALVKSAGLRKNASLIAAMAVAAWLFACRRAVEQVQAGRSLSRVRRSQRATLERVFSALEIAFSARRND